MKYIVIDRQGHLVDTFDSRKDAELFVAEQPRSGDYDIVEEEECGEPSNLFLDHSNLIE